MGVPPGESRFRAARAPDAPCQFALHEGVPDRMAWKGIEDPSET
jgi:hypothetical protein